MSGQYTHKVEQYMQNIWTHGLPSLYTSEFHAYSVIIRPSYTISINPSLERELSDHKVLTLLFADANLRPARLFSATFKFSFATMSFSVANASFVAETSSLNVRTFSRSWRATCRFRPSRNHFLERGWMQSINTDIQVVHAQVNKHSSVREVMETHVYYIILAHLWHFLQKNNYYTFYSHGVVIQYTFIQNCLSWTYNLQVCEQYVSSMWAVCEQYVSSKLAEENTALHTSIQIY